MKTISCNYCACRTAVIDGKLSEYVKCLECDSNYNNFKPNKENKMVDVGDLNMNEDTEQLKKEINKLIWMYSLDTITLGEAEQIAIDILAMIKNGYNVQELQVSRIRT